MEFGYAGNILGIDLSSGSITHVPTAYYSGRFIGGRGIAAKIYWDEVLPSVKAFDAANRLILVTGPLAGFSGLAGSRIQICGKSPNTSPAGFSYATLGGDWGAELKSSGYDGVIVHGKSERPVYLLIQDGRAEIRDASALWGKSPAETSEILKGHQGNSFRILSTGQAGENRVSFATVVTDDGSTGSSGFGAVLGSKMLKAIAVSGSGKVSAADPEKLRDITQNVRRLTRDRTITPPTFAMPEKRYACRGCIAGCIRTVFQASNAEKGKSMCQAAGFYKGPAMDYYKQPTEVPFQANRLCNNYGLDTMVVEPIILWLLRCQQAGILTDQQAEIPVSRFGSLEFIETAVKKIALRDGFGDILAEGILRAADRIGKDAAELISDLILPRTGEIYVYDPRFYITTGLFYALEPKRPIHQLHEVSMLMLHWHAWYEKVAGAYFSTDVVRAIAKKFWGSELAGDFSTYEGKAMAAKKIQDRQYVNESLILCNYSWPIAHIRYSADHVGDSSIESQIFSAVTGQMMDEEGLYRMGERIFNLQRAILVREGHNGREADMLPGFNYTVPFQPAGYKPECRFNPDCLLPGEDGRIISKKGIVLDREKFEMLKNEYYDLREWDLKSGLQTEKKLKDLELKDIAEGLARNNQACNETAN